MSSRKDRLTNTKLDNKAFQLILHVYGVFKNKVAIKTLGNGIKPCRCTHGISERLELVIAQIDPNPHFCRGRRKSSDGRTQGIPAKENTSRRCRFLQEGRDDGADLV
jgi:hypothetical protein